jgi:hypothetical protein
LRVVVLDADGFACFAKSERKVVVDESGVLGLVRRMCSTSHMFFLDSDNTFTFTCSLSGATPLMLGLSSVRFRGFISSTPNRSDRLMALRYRKSTRSQDLCQTILLLLCDILPPYASISPICVCSSLQFGIFCCLLQLPIVLQWLASAHCSD